MKRYQIVGLLLMLAFVMAGCGASAANDEHAGMMGMSGMSDHSGMMAAHAIPEEAAAVANPVAISDASLAAGQAIYTQNCAACHGTQGEGDGVAAAGLNPKPADLHATHVQELSDGALFYVITHGREGTAMVAWENILSEEQRWQVVNFLRTFKP
jgi:mono/diheme cytochrome c family protein